MYNSCILPAIKYSAETCEDNKNKKQKGLDEIRDHIMHNGTKDDKFKVKSKKAGGMDQATNRGC